MATLSGSAKITLQVEFYGMECPSFEDGEAQFIQEIKDCLDSSPRSLVYESIEVDEFQIENKEYDVTITIKATATDKDTIRHVLNRHINEASICTDGVEFSTFGVEIYIEEA